MIITHTNLKQTVNYTSLLKYCEVLLILLFYFLLSIQMTNLPYIYDINYLCKYHIVTLTYNLIRVSGLENINLYMLESFLYSLQTLSKWL